MTMATTNGLRIHRIALAALALSIAWIATAGADDLLDRQVQFEVPGQPLSKALIAFSTQSGVQVAVADADVSRLWSNGVIGVYPIREALNQLLHGTGLEYSRVGANTLAIRNPGSGAAPAAVAANPPQPASSAPSNSAGKFPDVTVFSTTPPTDQELMGDSVYQFIVGHATKKVASSDAFATSARWRGGRPETICPLTLGLDAAYNSFVSARLRALAAYVGAPAQPDLHCNENVQIVFSSEPDKLMDEVVQRAAGRFGVKLDHQIKRQEEFSGGHAIQGWYLTSPGGGGVLNTDPEFLGGVELQPMWPRVILGGCCSGGIVGAIFVIDTTKVAGYTVGSIADYVSVLTLSPVENPDHCTPLPSILDLMAPSCGTREKPAAVTAGDVAFLKALYYDNTGLGRTLTRSEMQLNMMQQFRGH
jgi:Secretin and TonB N terminus short domain